MSGQGRTRLIERAATRYELESRAESEGFAFSAGPPRVITISRQQGSGGRRLAEALAEDLDCRLWDKEILDVMVGQDRLGHSQRMFESVDEKTQSAIDAFASSLVGDVDRFLYMHLLPKALAAIATQDAVILGRGAHLVLPHALKIRVVASVRTRIENLMEHEGQTRDAAREKVRTSDRERAAFLKDFARQLGVRVPEADREAQYDLVLNTDELTIKEALGVVRELAGIRFGKRVRGEPIASGQDEKAG